MAPLRLAGALVALAAVAAAHDGHEPHPVAPDAPRVAARTDGLTGSGRWIFRHVPLELPDQVRANLAGAHGGFAPDRTADGGTGATWFSLKGVGLLRLAPDLSRVDVVGGDAALGTHNLHNTSVFRTGGKPYLALPSDEAQRLFVTDLEGALVRTFVNPHGPGGPPFRVCDVELVAGRLVATNGYADNLCFVADPLSSRDDFPGIGVWSDTRFGGAGTEHGRFGTAHGITRVPGTDVFTIADRANARLESFAPFGRYVGGVRFEEGTMPCDVDYLPEAPGGARDLALVGCLTGPGGSNPAPIYLLEGGNVVAELNPGRDLGLEEFQHVHNAAFHVVRGPDGTEKLYVVAQAWNPGGFAILEHVPQAVGTAGD